MRLCVAVIFNKDKNRKLPRLISVLIGNKVKHFDLYREDSLKSIKKIKNDLNTIRELLLKANDKQIDIVCQNFRDLLNILELPLDARTYSVYDQHIPKVESSDCVRQEEIANVEILNVLNTLKLKNYQKILANSSVVYADLEKNGLYYNYIKVYPKWSQKTYTGRSKSLDFNIQGLATSDYVYSAFGNEGDVLIYFDWVCADIRIASMLAGDLKLAESFTDSDPYTHLANILNDANKMTEEGETITFDRDECKLILLRAINSMDYNNVVFEDAYPKLGDWIYKLSEKDVMTTILGRPFKIEEDKSRLSAFNGVMQGSVAHAMQIVMRKLWEAMGSKLVCEIHDSIVLSCKNDPKDIKAMVKQVCKVMVRPFDNVIEGDYVFPVKVSMGRKWKSLTHYKTIYDVE